MDANKFQLYLDQNPFAKLSKVVCNLLFDEIVALNLPPSGKINIKQIALELNISRTPVIDALKELQAIGFVETRSDTTGFYVSELSLPDMTNLYNIRAAIESEAAYRCAKNVGKDVVERLEAMAENFRDAIISKNPFLVRETDVPFHKLIVKSASNKYLEQSYNNLLPSLIRYQRYCSEFIHFDSNNQWCVEIANHHCAIVSAIKLHLANQARECMNDHINLCIYQAAFTHDEADPFKLDLQ